jgi:hypothetical protein
MLELDQEYTLPKIAKHYNEMYSYNVIVYGKQSYGCINYQSLNIVTTLPNFDFEKIFNVTNISENSVRFYQGTLLDRLELFQDGPIVEVYGYNKELWDKLDVIYEKERDARLHNIPVFCRSSKRLKSEPFLLLRKK